MDDQEINRLANTTSASNAHHSKAYFVHFRMVPSFFFKFSSLPGNRENLDPSENSGFFFSRLLAFRVRIC